MRELSSSVELTDEDRDYVEAALAGMYAKTRTAYARDLVRFSLFFDPDGCGRLRALDRFLELEAPTAHAVVWNYREQMARAELGPSTINRRLSALRAFCTRAQQTGRIVWTLNVPGIDPPPARFYDVSPDDVAQVIHELSQGPASFEPARARDACAIRLTWDLGLRRAELIAIDVGDVDLSRALVYVKKKGASDKRAIQLPEHSQNALARWIAVRAGADGLTTPALFIELKTFLDVQGQERIVTRGRLSERGFYGIVARRTRQILGRPLNPHALRHGSITCALETTNGNVARVATGFANHADIRTTIRYDNMRRADGAWISHRVSESVPGPEPSSALTSPASSRASIMARASVGLHLSRSSAERSAILARSSFVGPATTPWVDGLGRARYPEPFCSECGAREPGAEGWKAVNGLRFCSSCVVG